MSPGARNLFERVRRAGRTASGAVAKWDKADWLLAGALAGGIGFCIASLWAWAA